MLFTALGESISVCLMSSRSGRCLRTGLIGDGCPRDRIPMLSMGTRERENGQAFAPTAYACTKYSSLKHQTRLHLQQHLVRELLLLDQRE